MEKDKNGNQLLFIMIWTCVSVMPCFGARNNWNSRSNGYYRRAGSKKEIFIGAFLGVVAVLITILILCIICKRLTRPRQHRTNTNMVSTVSAGVQESTAPPPYTIHDTLYSTGIQHITKYKSNYQSTELVMVQPPQYTELGTDQSPPAYSENTSNYESEPNSSNNSVPLYSRQEINTAFAGSSQPLSRDS